MYVWWGWGGKGRKQYSNLSLTSSPLKICSHVIMAILENCLRNLDVNVIPVTFFCLFSKTGQNQYLRCSQSFLFSMVNPQGVDPIKMPLAKDHQYAIYCNSCHGPTFGRGHDLQVSNNANKSGSSYSNLGNSYQLPTEQQNTFFTGARNFGVTDYEVFGIYQ